MTSSIGTKFMFMFMFMRRGTVGNWRNHFNKEHNDSAQYLLMFSTMACMAQVSIPYYYHS